MDGLSLGLGVVLLCSGRQNVLMQVDKMYYHAGRQNVLSRGKTKCIIIKINRLFIHWCKKRKKKKKTEHPKLIFSEQVDKFSCYNNY